MPRKRKVRPSGRQNRRISSARLEVLCYSAICSVLISGLKHYSGPSFLHSSPSLLSQPPLIHSSPSLLSQPPLSPFSHTLLSQSPLPVSSLSLLSYTPLPVSSQDCTSLSPSSPSLLCHLPLLSCSPTFSRILLSHLPPVPACSPTLLASFIPSLYTSFTPFLFFSEPIPLHPRHFLL